MVDDPNIADGVRWTDDKTGQAKWMTGDQLIRFLRSVAEEKVDGRMKRIDSALEGAVRGMATAFATERAALRNRVATLETEIREIMVGFRAEVLELKLERDKLLGELEALPTRWLKAVP